MLDPPPEQRRYVGASAMLPAAGRSRLGQDLEPRLRLVRRRWV